MAECHYAVMTEIQSAHQKFVGVCFSAEQQGGCQGLQQVTCGGAMWRRGGPGTADKRGSASVHH